MNRTFSQLDQDVFARLSGDFNPLHVDPVAARRFLFGGCVVHGIHAVLWALDQWLESQNAPVELTKLKANFRRPIPVGVEVSVAIRAKAANAARIETISAEGALMQIDLAFSSVVSDWPPVAPALPDRQPCRDRSVDELRSASGRIPLCLEPRTAMTLFPTAARLLPPQQVAMLLALTRLVGMEAPGLHSVFLGFELTSGNVCGGGELVFRAESFDERFSLLEMRVESPGLVGQVRAALRPRPREQATMNEMRSLVGPDEFHGEKVLVIGGSRGLGEAAVKLLAAGGAELRFTYHRGLAEADRLAAELRDSGASAECFSYDAAKDAPRLAGLLGAWSPTLLGYFATPFIFGAAPGRFAYQRFAGFCDVYVKGFGQTTESLIAMGALRRVLYPSSSALDELPANMGEYAAAKAAGESLCRFLQKAHPRIGFHQPRLPRLATDQTASLLADDAGNPAEVILWALREMFSKDTAV